MNARVFAVIVLLGLVVYAGWHFFVTSRHPSQFYLYYYNPSLDKDTSGNVICSAKGLVPVVHITKNNTAQHAVEVLLLGKIAEEDRNRGVTTEFPLPGLEVASSTLENGVFTLTFSDPQFKTSGGSCRVAILRAEIEATAKQFHGITSVRFLPEDLFQP